MEALFWKLQPLVMRRVVEDVLSWKESRNDIFSIRSLLVSFALEYYLEVLGSDEGEFFCLESVLEQNFDR